MIYTNGRADTDLEQGTWSCRRRMWVAAVGCTWIISFWSLRQLVYNSPHPRPIIGFCPKLAYEIIPRDICLANEPLIATKTAIQALLEAFIESWQMWILLLFFLVRKMLRCYAVSICICFMNGSYVDVDGTIGENSSQTHLKARTSAGFYPS